MINGSETVSANKPKAIQSRGFCEDVHLMWVCVPPVEAPASVQRTRVCYGMWFLWSLHVSGDGLAGLWSEVSLLILW